MKKKIIYLQSLVRKNQTQKSFKKQIIRVIRAQALMRMYLQRTRYRKTKIATIKTQALIKGFLWRSRTKRLLKLQREKKAFVIEMRDIENTFVRNAQMCLQIFLIPMQRNLAIPKEMISAIFGNYEQIVTFHIGVLTKLQKLAENVRYFDEVGKFYIGFFEGSIEYMYKLYVINFYHNALNAYNVAKKKYKF